MESMGDRIHNKRLECNLTMEQLGEKVGVQKSAINKWEKNIVQNLKRDVIAKLSEALKCDPVWLMYGEEKEEEHYYLDEQSREMAQWLFDNPEYKVLFDASRNVKPEDIQFVKDFIDRISNK